MHDGVTKAIIARLQAQGAQHRPMSDITQGEHDRART